MARRYLHAIPVARRTPVRCSESSGWFCYANWNDGPFARDGESFSQNYANGPFDVCPKLNIEYFLAASRTSETPRRIV
jgi:hypothetical protein